jgi:glycosyltransferase involved in cell wall biosynthesis
MEAVLDHATLILANSNSTAEEIGAYAQRRGSSPPPICVAPLGLEPHFTDTSDETLRARPYFVCVGTIEPRKNLTFLLTLWRRLAERRGAATPVLILVGQRGWENESVIDHLDRSPPIQQFVHEVCGLADWELARLIAGARALLSPSFSEGFNLPVAEAQALGTPVIASDIAVHRELARDARLIDPLDGPAWLAAIEATADHGRSTRRSRPTSWEAHFAAVGEAMGLEGDERPGASLASRRLVT